MKHKSPASVQWATPFFILCIHTLIGANPPKLTIVLVIDGCNQHTIEKVSQNFTGGIKQLHSHGIIYKDGHHELSAPTTAPGHAALNTGTHPHQHGWVANFWYTPNGDKVICDQDNPETSAVFNPNGDLYPYGKSNINCYVDGISDQFILAAQPFAKKEVVSFSLKSRAAIAMAGSTGTAFWFDRNSGQFTSSKAYVKALPDWLTQFNHAHDPTAITEYTWQPAYDLKSAKYNYAHINDFTFAKIPSSVNKIFKLAKDYLDKDRYKAFYRTPGAVQQLFDLAAHYVQHHLKTHSETDLLLWISVSSIDKLGHLYGNESLDYIDMLYHIDKKYGVFLEQIGSMIEPKKVLHIFTADHGSMPIPELLQKRNIPQARRVLTPKLLDELNAGIEKKYHISPAILALKQPNLYLNHALLDSLPIEIQNKIIETIIKQLSEYSFIKTVWRQAELLMWHPRNRIEKNFRLHCMPSRSGDIIFQVHPYTYFTRHSKGTGHLTPYDYDTHVPLVIYQPEHYENKIVYDRVQLTQLPGTLAHILHVPRPSASDQKILPSIIPHGTPTKLTQPT